MRVLLLHVGGNIATIMHEGETFRVFVNKNYTRAFSDADSAREYAIKVLSVMDGEFSGE